LAVLIFQGIFGRDFSFWLEVWLVFVLDPVFWGLIHEQLLLFFLHSSLIFLPKNQNPLEKSSKFISE
jgi:hypothetical protein